MSIKTILTAATILAGSSSLVFADPPRDEHHEHHERHEEHEHHERHGGITFGYGIGQPGFGVYVGPGYNAPTYYQYGPPPYYNYNPPTLQYSGPYGAPYANPYQQSPFVNGQMYIDLDGAMARGIRLISNAGQTYVRSVEIHYTDGDVQRVQVNRVLDPNNPELDLAIGREPIASVVINGAGAGVATNLF